MKRINLLAISFLLIACSGVGVHSTDNNNQDEDAAVSLDGSTIIQEDSSLPQEDAAVQEDASLDPDSEVPQEDAQVQEDAEVQADASLPFCGNGYSEPGEVCDDGNQNNNDGCPDDVANGGNCQLAVCGDGFIWTGQETCDDGNNVDDLTCYANCQGYCGDGVLDTSKGEDCDDGNNINDATCYGDCSGWCGDGDIQGPLSGGFEPDHGEECDGGQYDPNNNCTEVCTIPYCGDGICTYNDDTCCIDVMNPIVETASNCPQDCGQNPIAAVQCTAQPQLWCPNIYVMDTPYNNGDVMIAGQCCGNGECIIWQSDWFMDDHMYVYNIQNCNWCGNHCVGLESCIFGVGCMLNP